MTMDRATYWKRQLRRISVLLLIWFVVGYGMSIFAIETLNSITLGGLPLGFWMAQQGSIFVFIVLVGVYAFLSGRADAEAGVSEADAPSPGTPSPS